MRIAVGSDMKTSLTDYVTARLREKGHSLHLFGALVEGENPHWPNVGISVASAVAEGNYDQGIVFCWTGTGISIAANKVKGIRAALCQDAQTASGARKWNDANVLAMSIRSTSEAIASEILAAWFSGEVSDDFEDQTCFLTLKEAEAQRFK